MCETMANVPMEDRPSCVLTEDMFDAAMNQQFSYQDDIESEEELSSQEENMEVDPDTQGSSQDSSENMEGTVPPQCNITTTSVSRENTPSCDSPAVSVLVIETGLDKTKQHSNTCEEAVSLVIETGLDKSKQHSNTCEEAVANSEPAVPLNHSEKNGCNNDDLDGVKNIQNQNSVNSNLTQENRDSKEQKLPILKKILSNDSTIESIDLCDSESEEFSAEDELPGVETIDDELKSVMESNLMAEIGMSINKQKGPEHVASKTVQSSPPKIAVKSMAQVPSDIFNTLPQKKIVTSSTEAISSSTNTCSNSINNEIGGFKSLTDLALQGKEDVPTTIHINRIAVPHQTFVNSQGQKMKCVYVRNHNSLPLVINSNQASTYNKPPKYLMGSQLKKVLPKQMPPIMALSNMTVKNMNPKKTILAKMPTKVLAIAPKFQRPPLLRNAPPRPHQFHLDENVDSLIKSLLFHNLKKPYKPPVELESSTSTFVCLDCSDRFLLQTSLNQHLARRSLSICYWCRICKVQLQFFNRCVFLKHLRGHNCSIKNIDTTCISFSPLSTEAIEGGIASSFLKNESGSDLPAKDCILQKSIKSVVQTEDLTKKSGNCVGLSEKTISSVIVQSPSNKKITTVAGQSQSFCFQTKTSALLNKPIPSPAVSSQSSPKIFPIVLPKPPQIPTVVQTVQKQTQDQTVSNKKVTNNVLLVRSPLPGSDINKNGTHMNSSTPNLASETESRDIDDVVIDEDTEKTNENQEEEEVDVENVTENNTCLGTDTKINPKKSKEKPASTSLRRYCGECGASCVNINKHLNGSNRPTNSKLACEVCKLILPTRCALKIHLRIHMKLPPFKCPDCGKDFNTWDDVNAHVKFSCGHLAKCVRYMCVSCKAHFASANNLGNHIMTTHSRDIYKCTACPVAFFNKDSLNKHLATIHPKERVVGTDYKQCSLCPKKLVPIDKFVSHVQDHTKANNVLMYGYKCPLCFIVFANKMAFIIHQIKEKKEFEEKGTTTNINNNAMADQEINNAQDALSDSNSDIEEEPVIVPKYPGQEETLPAEKDPLSLDGWEHTQGHQVNEKTEELCIVCKTNAVVLLPGIDLNDQSLCCKQCVKPLDVVDSRAQSNKTLVNSNNGTAYNLSNAMRNKLDKTMKRKNITPKVVQRSYSLDDANSCNKKRKTIDGEFFENDLASHQYLDMIPVKKKNRKKQYKDKATFAKEQAHIQGQVVDSKSANELLCAKCKFVADTREAFLEHITIHRTDPNSFQCLECGLCFVVLPSLERHLQINHGIKDVSIYIENNRSSLPEKFVSFEEEADDNQCRVCHEMFDSISSLEKHFRSHGMAFMNSLSKSP